MKTAEFIDRWKKLDINKKTFLVGGILVFLGLLSTVLLIMGLALCIYAGSNIYWDIKKKSMDKAEEEHDFKIDKKDGAIR